MCVCGCLSCCLSVCLCALAKFGPDVQNILVKIVKIPIFYFFFGLEARIGGVGVMGMMMVAKSNKFQVSPLLEIHNHHITNTKLQAKISLLDG